MPDIELMGATYPDVPAVVLPKSGGGDEWAHPFLGFLGDEARIAYVANGSLGQFVPMNANFGLVARHTEKIKGGKKVRYQFYADRALKETDRIVNEEEL